MWRAPRENPSRPRGNVRPARVSDAQRTGMDNVHGLVRTDGTLAEGPGGKPRLLHRADAGSRKQREAHD